MASKRALFEETRSLWPPQLRITGINESRTAVMTQPPLYEVYESISAELASDDGLGQIATWSFHQALDKLGRRKFQQAEGVLHPGAVSFRSFNTMMLSNLSQDDWASAREFYLRLP